MPRGTCSIRSSGFLALFRDTSGMPNLVSTVRKNKNNLALIVGPTGILYFLKSMNTKFCNCNSQLIILIVRHYSESLLLQVNEYEFIISNRDCNVIYS